MGRKSVSEADVSMESVGAKNTDEGKEEERSYDEKLLFVNSIAKPMASKKLCKKLFKVLKKASKHKEHYRHGLKMVQTRIRKGEKGLLLLAGDVTPIEIMCHMPAVAEEKSIPYCYTPSRTDLGNALGFHRSCVMAMVLPHDDYKDLYDECVEEIKHLPVPL